MMSAYAAGDTSSALKIIDDSRKRDRPRPAVWMRLMGAFAEILTELEWTRDAQAAVEEYRSAAEQAGERNHELTADLLAAKLLVQAGQPEGPSTPHRGLHRAPADHTEVSPHVLS